MRTPARIRRWWVMRFRTTATPRLLTLDSDAQHGWREAIVPGWHVERPDWWRRGSTSGVTAETIERARRDLDEWQDDQWRRV